MKKIIILTIFIITAIFIYKLTQKNPHISYSDKEAQIILFFGDGCPHCKLVEQYITENKVDNKVKIAYKEVYYNKSNQILLEETVKKCPEIDSTQGIGVPLAFINTTGQCLPGDKPIIDWLSKQ